MNPTQKKTKINGKEVYSPFRSLRNYKEMHQDTAREKGVLAEFLAARTLTQARRLVFG